ncbi:hypothetical protein [Acidaminobacter sp. JC074]|uniref:hypothetical protein n=1 Tax=Acidaminobacter sp. JC074 TaxID=2530199 RepID=UPI001F108B39|nr:hypothetical protein [Acidaminobacter sp. JC074]
MALNKEILKRLDEKTMNDKSTRDFLIALLQIESEGRGWYDKDYNQLLERFCEGGNDEI